MKEATGKYVKVRAITKRQSVNLAKKLFSAEGSKLYAEGNKLRAEGNKLRAEGNKLHADIAIKHKGYIPDWRAINFIAKDLPNHVYCFVWEHKEIWVYNGEDCPNREDVKVEVAMKQQIEGD